MKKKQLILILIVATVATVLAITRPPIGQPSVLPVETLENSCGKIENDAVPDTESSQEIAFTKLCEGVDGPCSNLEAAIARFKANHSEEEIEELKRQYAAWEWSHGIGFLASSETSVDYDSYSNDVLKELAEVGDPVAKFRMVSMALSIDGPDSAKESVLDLAARGYSEIFMFQQGLHQMKARQASDPELIRDHTQSRIVNLLLAKEAHNSSADVTLMYAAEELKEVFLGSREKICDEVSNRLAEIYSLRLERGLSGEAFTKPPVNLNVSGEFNCSGN